MNEALLEDAWNGVREKLQAYQPGKGVILGSGWSDAVERLDIQEEIPYEDILGLGKTGVQGHAGRLLIAKVKNDLVAIFQGRRHYYEGEGWTPIAIPIYILKKLGIQKLLLTNAAGGVREDLVPGTLMVISDHINNFSSHPLIGPHMKIWGPRFPDQSTVYDTEMREQLHHCARDLGFELKEGVYLASTGPTYETPAEVRCYKTWGADAVGMSTIPEAMLASGAGIKVVGLSCISNWAAGISKTALTHDEVTETTQSVMPKMEALLKTFLAR